MKKKMKMMTAVLCAIALVVSGMIPQVPVAEAATDGVSLGADDTYLKTHQPLTDTPDAIEAKVKMDSKLGGELVSTADIVGHTQISKTTYALTSAEASEAGLSAGTEVAKQTGALDGGKIWFSKSISFDLSGYDLNQVKIVFDVYNGGTEARTGQMELSSSGKADYNEIYFNISAPAGQWTHIEKAIADFGNTYPDTNGYINYSAVNFTRLHGFATSDEAGLFYMSEIRIVLPETQSIQIESCDSASGDASVDNVENITGDGGVVVSSEIKEGAGAFQNSGDGMIRFYMKLRNAIDISSVSSGNFEFWLYWDGNEGLTADHLVVELGSGGKEDVNSIVWTYLTSDLQQGWNAVQLPFAQGGNNNVDYTQINFFRMYLMKDGAGVANASTFVLDDLRATYTQSPTVEVVTNSKQLFSCDYEEYAALEGQWLAYASTGDFDDDIADKEGTGLLKSESGQVRYQFQLPESNAIDISEYTDGYFQFRLYIPEDQLTALNAASNMTIELATNFEANTTDKNEQSWVKSIADLSAGWNEISLPFETTKELTIDYTQVNFFRMYLNTSVTATMYLDDLRAVHAPLESTQMIFSNSNVNDESSTFALYVTKDGCPAVMYNRLQYTLKNYNICNGDWTTIKVVKIPDINMIQFQINENPNEDTDPDVTGTWEVVSIATVAMTENMGAPEYSHCVGADGSGGQIMHGTVSLIHVMTCDNNVWSNLARWEIAPDGVQGDIVNAYGDNQLGFRGSKADALSYTVGYYNDITAYRTGMTAPVKDDYVFAGWYTDATCTKATALASDVTGGTAYAKWVDEDILGLKAQVLLGTDGELGDVATMRFVTSVDTLNYYKVAFEVRIGEITKTSANCTQVYSTLMALSDDDVYAKKSASDIFGTRAAYFKAYTVRKIPSSAYDTPITVVPFWVTLDGTRVNGPLEVKTVNQVNQ